MEKSVEVSQNIKNRTTTWSAIPLLGIYPGNYARMMHSGDVMYSNMTTANMILYTWNLLQM